MAGRVDITKSPEWVAAIAALRGMDKALSAATRKYTKSMAEPEWKKKILSLSRTLPERRVISGTATVAVSNSNVRAKSGAKGRPLSGGLSMSQAAPAYEFGSRKYKQFGPRRKKGPFYRTAENMGPRLASLWVQTVMKTVALALEGKR